MEMSGYIIVRLLDGMDELRVEPLFKTLKAQLDDDTSGIIILSPNKSTKE